MAERDRSNDMWTKGAKEDYYAVELRRSPTKPQGEGEGNEALDKLMALVEPEGWQWVKLESKFGDVAPPKGAEDLVKAYDELIEHATAIRDELMTYSVIEDETQVPSHFKLEDAWELVDEMRTVTMRALEEDEG